MNLKQKWSRELACWGGRGRGGAVKTEVRDGIGSRQEKKPGVGGGSVWSGQMCVRQLSPPCYCCDFHSLELSLPVCLCSFPPPSQEDLKQQPLALVTVSDTAEPLVFTFFIYLFIFSVSILSWDDGSHAMSSITAVSSTQTPPHIKKKELKSFSSRSQFWLGVNNERKKKQEGRSERGTTELQGGV